MDRDYENAAIIKDLQHTDVTGLLEQHVMHHALFILNIHMRLSLSFVDVIWITEVVPAK
jgi:hypothetical protein